MREEELGECVTCSGEGIVDIGTCPDCLGSGDDIGVDVAFERFLNSNVGRRLDDDDIEPHVLQVMWCDKVVDWSQKVAAGWDHSQGVLALDPEEFCESHECGGCGEHDPPCESYKLWFAGMQLARVVVYESRITSHETPSSS
ncbi:MAG: hypothetical protein ABFE01_20375 [Phycisphaerales bacterium]